MADSFLDADFWFEPGGLFGGGHIGNESSGFARDGGNVFDVGSESGGIVDSVREGFHCGSNS